MNSRLERESIGVISTYTAGLGFTLIELLFVMAIIASLATLSVPSFTSLGKSAGLNGGGNMVAGLITSARQNALSKNTMTALVIVTDSSVDPQNRLFTMMELPAHEDNTTKPQSSDWKQITKWETLVRGVIVSNWTSSPQTVSPTFPKLRYGNHWITQDGFKYLIFMPDGSTLSNTSTTVQLVEGYIPKGETVPLYTSVLKNGNPANYYKLTILNTTGRIKIDRP
ncbi:MAG: Tfp pilus assembly protein FimT/FimU [Chthoniobacteraceae bacterium]